MHPAVWHCQYGTTDLVVAISLLDEVGASTDRVVGCFSSVLGVEVEGPKGLKNKGVFLNVTLL